MVRIPQMGIPFSTPGVGPWLCVPPNLVHLGTLFPSTDFSFVVNSRQTRGVSCIVMADLCALNLHDSEALGRSFVIHKSVSVCVVWHP